MSLALIIPDRKLDDLQQRLALALADTRIEIWPDIAKPDEVEFAVVWKQPHGSLAALPNLKAIQCFEPESERGNFFGEGNSVRKMIKIIQNFRAENPLRNR